MGVMAPALQTIASSIGMSELTLQILRGSCPLRDASEIGRIEVANGLREGRHAVAREMHFGS
jgi:hypothetical protein